MREIQPFSVVPIHNNQSVVNVAPIHKNQSEVKHGHEQMCESVVVLIVVLSSQTHGRLSKEGDGKNNVQTADTKGIEGCTEDLVVVKSSIVGKSSRFRRATDETISCKLELLNRAIT
jgi:hypothetical protein